MFVSHHLKSTCFSIWKIPPFLKCMVNLFCLLNDLAHLCINQWRSQDFRDDGEAPALKMGMPTCYLVKFSTKTAWKIKKLERGRCLPVPPWIFQCTCDQTSCTRSHIALLPVINSSNDFPSKSNLFGFFARVQIPELKTWKSWAFSLEGYTTRTCEPAATSDGVLCDICCPLESSV